MARVRLSAPSSEEGPRQEQRSARLSSESKASGEQAAAHGAILEKRTATRANKLTLRLLKVLPDAMPTTEAPLLSKLEALPAPPGCYLFKDKKGEVVYVGKAKSLRSRVRSYFQESSGDERYFIPILQRTRRRPRDDRHRDARRKRRSSRTTSSRSTGLATTSSSATTRTTSACASTRSTPGRALEPVRRPCARRRALLRAVPLGDRRAPHAAPRQQALSAPDVHRPELRGRKRPCLQYQIKRCPAPCVSTSTRPGTTSRCAPSRCSSTAATTSSRASSRRA